MTGRITTLSTEGTTISQADLDRIEAEERLHAEQQRKAARVIAAAARDVDDCTHACSTCSASITKSSWPHARSMRRAPLPDAVAAAPLDRFIWSQYAACDASLCAERVSRYVIRR